jgi:integrase
MGLTDKTIRAAKPAEGKTIKLSDGGGLQLWVTPAGTRLWNLAYRFAGKQRKLAIGPYPRITLKDARGRREDAKRQLGAGIDPSQQKRLAKLSAAADQASIFKALADEYVEKKRKEGKAARTISKLEWLLGIANRTLGPRPISGIGAPEILHVLRAVEAREKLESAKRLRAVIGAVFRYAMATGRASVDPTTALRGALTAPVVRHRAAIVAPAPFGELLRAIDGYEGMPEVRIALQLLALTFVRPGELRGARWPEFDLDKAVWTIPAERAKVRRPHRVPLSGQSIEALNRLRAITGTGSLILPGARSRNRPLSDNTLNAALRRLGYTGDEMTSHGFRATASSMLNESGKWNADAIEAQLAHLEGNAVRRAYARAEFWDERVKMMGWWANRLDHLRCGAEVIPMAAAS